MDARLPAAPRPTRRGALGLIGGAVALASGARAQEPAEPAPLSDGQPFAPGKVVDLARALARKPHVAPPTALPSGLSGLTYEQYVAVRALPDAMVWAGEGRGFVVEPLARGFVFTTPVAIHLVEDGLVRRLRFDPSRFSLGGLRADGADGLDLSGFRLHVPRDGGRPLDFATFQGASFFRAVAEGQSYGVTSRALSLWVAEGRGEEFPAFRSFWIERPAPGSDVLVVHALVDSPSATAALRLTLRPGRSSMADVEGTLFARASLDHVGLAGMSASHLFAGNDRRGVDDPRPAVQSTGALRIENGRGEVLLRPVKNPEALEISSFLDLDPKGFGLIQRDRDYRSYQDDVQRWERRPSLWVEPAGGWGPGSVQLVEIPSGSEVNENVLAYWRPKAPVAAGAEMPFAYRQTWCQDPPEPPELARVTNTRSGKASGGKRRLFYVDFTGEALFDGRQEPRVLLAAAGGKVSRQRTFPYPDSRTLRVVFEVEPEGDRPPELRLSLAQGDAVVSETWLYR